MKSSGAEREACVVCWAVVNTATTTASLTRPLKVNSFAELKHTLCGAN